MAVKKNTKKPPLLQKIKELFTVKNKTGLKYGSMALVLTVIFVAAVILLNVVVGLLSDRFALRLDMTSDQRYAISKETKNLLKDMDFECDIVVFATESSYRELTYGYELAETLYRYTAYSAGKVSLEFVDPLKNPDYVNRYSSEIDLREGDIIVATEERFEHIPFEDQYWWYDTAHSYVVGTSIERRVTMAIADLSVSKEEMPVAAVLISKETVISEELLRLLADNNYSVVGIDLAVDEIPENTSLLVINAPGQDFTDYEINKIETYLLAHNDMMISLGYNKPVLPNLELFLKEWGIEYGNGIVLDAKYRAEGAYYAPATYPSSENTDFAAITEGISNNQYIIMPYSRPMQTTWMNNTEGVKTITPLLTTSDVAYVKYKDTDAQGTLGVLEKVDGDGEGPFIAAALMNYMQYEGRNEVETNIIFLSSPYLFSDDLVNAGSYGNMRFINNVLSELNPLSMSVSVQNKTFDDPELAVIGNTLSVILFFLIAIPAVCLFMGVFVWYRRKNR